MKKIKKLFILVCVLTCIFTLTSCGESKKDKASFSYNESELVTSVSENTEAIGGCTDVELDQLIESYQGNDANAALRIGLDLWKKTRNDAGKFVELEKDDAGAMKYNLSVEDDIVYIKGKVKCEKRNVTAEYGFGVENSSLTIKSISYETNYTMKDSLTKAALNTLLGISTVTVVLIFLCFLISLFKYINRIQTKFSVKKELKEKVLDKAVSQIVEKEESGDLQDDTELVAVITSAIASIEQTSADGFVVRSIRKVPNSKWKRS